MTPRQPMKIADDEHRVLQFRPRSQTHVSVPHTAAAEKDLRSAPVLVNPRLVTLQPDDLARYEREREEPDDFQHRMLANIAAFAFTVALTAVALWLSVSIAKLL